MATVPDGVLHVTVTADPVDGGWVAEITERLGLLSQGETPADALRNVADALDEAP